MKTAVTVLALVLTIATASAREDTRPFDHYATKECKSDSCFSPHPNGTYTFPYHYGHRR